MNEPARSPIGAALNCGRILWTSVALAGAWVAFFQIYRIILMISTHGFASGTSGTLLLESVTRGLQLDISAAVRVCALFGIWLIVRRQFFRFERKIFLALHA